MRSVEVDQLRRVFDRILKIRRWVLREGINSFAFRQALVMALEIDTIASLEQGIDPFELWEFDQVSREVVRREVERWRVPRP